MFWVVMYVWNCVKKCPWEQNSPSYKDVIHAGMATSEGKLLSCILFPEKLLFIYDEELPIVVLLLLLYALVCFAVAIYFQVLPSYKLSLFCLLHWSPVWHGIPRNGHSTVLAVTSRWAHAILLPLPALQTLEGSYIEKVSLEAISISNYWTLNSELMSS